MKKTAPIVVGIDFSESSGSILRKAVHAGRLWGSPVIAVHVLKLGKLQHWGKGNQPDLMDQAKDRLQALVQRESPDAEIDYEICVGRPAEELERITKAHKASRLVIAANDTTKKNLGSIASRCIRTVSTDVLIVRNWQSGNFKKVMVCTNFAAASEQLVRKAVEIAATHNAALEVVNVIYPPDQDYWGDSLADVGEDDLSYTESIRAEAQARMDQCLASFSDHLKTIEHTATILESEVPSVALTFHVNDSGADLVVLGTRSHSKLASIFVGTNAEKLMNDSTVSVLAARI
jgi:nucleotide-binding universal stress UspA family protein